MEEPKSIDIQNQGDQNTEKIDLNPSEESKNETIGNDSSKENEKSTPESIESKPVQEISNESAKTITTDEQLKSENDPKASEIKSQTDQNSQSEILKAYEQDDDDEYEDIDDDEEVNIEDYKIKVENENSIQSNQVPNQEKKSSDKTKSNVTEKKLEEEKANIPLEPKKKGKFYQHDTRDDQNENKIKNEESKNEKWHHDKYNPKEKRPIRNGQNRKFINQDVSKQNQASTQEKDKGLSLQEYLEQNEAAKHQATNKEQKIQRPNQNSKQSNEVVPKPRQNLRRDLNPDNKPTSSDDLKSRLDYSTRIPTIVDDLFYEPNTRQISGQNKNNYRQNQFVDKRFDKSLDKSEKFGDMVITKDFESSKRHVTLNSNNYNSGHGSTNYNNRQNDRRQNPNRQQFTDYNNAQKNFRPQNQRRNLPNNNKTNDDSFKQYMAYVDNNE